jgi:hypothetical protein
MRCVRGHGTGPFPGRKIKAWEIGRTTTQLIRAYNGTEIKFRAAATPEAD